MSSGIEFACAESISKARFIFFTIRCVGSLLLVSTVCDTAQAASPCKGPADLEQVVAAHPSAGVYDALGALLLPAMDSFPALSASLRLRSSWHLVHGSGHYDLGIALLSSNNTKRAAHELQIASTLKPDTPKILLPLGVSLSQLNQQSAAIDAFRAVLKTGPAIGAGSRWINGSANRRKTSYTAASYWAELKNAPADEVLQLNLAIAYSKNGNVDEALQILSGIVKEHPEYAQAHNNLGIVYTQQKRFSEAAERSSDTALQLDPANDSVRLVYV